MIIAISGTPATGKTKVAKELSKKYKLKYIDLSSIKKNKLYESYDKSLKTYIIDIEKVKKFLIKLIKENKNLIIDSHLSHLLNKKYIDLCIITKCDIKVLKKRLVKRKYPEKKARENLDAEILDTCLVEAKEKKHNIKVIDTTKDLNKKELELNI